MGIIGIITVFGTGIAAGMYISSQIDNQINKNIKK